jgi:hypothetical protein
VVGAVNWCNEGYQERKRKSFVDVVAVAVVVVVVAVVVDGDSVARSLLGEANLVALGMVVFITLLLLLTVLLLVLSSSSVVEDVLLSSSSTFVVAVNGEGPTDATDELVTALGASPATAQNHTRETFFSRPKKSFCSSLT